MTYVDSNALAIGTVGTTNGITTTGGAVQVGNAGAATLDLGTVSLTGDGAAAFTLTQDLISGQSLRPSSLSATLTGIEGLVQSVAPELQVIPV